MATLRLLPLVVLGLASCGATSPGTEPVVASRSTVASQPTSAPAGSVESTTPITSSAPATPSTTTTNVPSTQTLAFTFSGVGGLAPRGDPQVIGASSFDEVTSVWSSTAGVTDAFLALQDVPVPATTSPEGDVTSVSVDVPNGHAWLVTSNGFEGEPPTSATQLMWWRDDGRLWIVSNLGITPEHLVALTLAVQPGSGLPHVLPDPTMTWVGFTTLRTFESVRQDWALDGANLELAVTNGGLAQQLARLSAMSVVDRTIAGAAGYEITLPNGQVNLIWPTDDADHWGSVLIAPPLADRVDDIAAAIVPT